MSRFVLSGTPWPLPLALSLLVSSTSSERWRGAVGEAARLLAPGWDDDSYISDLGTLALVLHLRAQDDRLPQKVPVQEILATLAPVDAAGEPEFVQESWELLRQTGEAPPIAGQVEEGAGQVWLVQRDLGDRYLGGDMDELHGPGPSAFQSATARLRALLADLDEERREALYVVPVPSGSVQVQAAGGVKVITTGSVMAMRCTHKGCPAEGGTVIVDGMRARYVCPDGHTSSPRTLAPAHARWALRHVGHDPASSGRLLVDGLFHVPQVSESPRMELSANVWLRQQQRGSKADPEVLRRLDAAADEFDRW
ncbi:hypothetical protein OG897_39900 [Streptomyces sp. NBC_00237]|uniref:hypothetical protein n=1 Tax=Streptomyces sp. NBC_00237 TaxID=2975687 RepID=UPI002252F6CD|nr:hypothetical protein [Streptomyces sp. NBC_00237]MCX5207556.1 hypothetical protein [Streptomyces sp. NBC_00237]